MVVKIVFFVCLIISQISLLPSWAQNESKTYLETRKLLLKMERDAKNKQLKKLFEQGDIWMQDLIKALDDPEEKVNLNSQIIIKYLAEPEGLTALGNWYEKQKREGRNYSSPIMELLSEPIHLEDAKLGINNLIMKNKKLFQAFAFNSGEVSINLIAYNKRTKTALVELIEGNVFTSGWHVVIRQEADKWELISDNNIWVH